MFDIAKITGSKNFISHVGYQSYLTDIWMGGIHASTPTWKVSNLNSNSIDQNIEYVIFGEGSHISTNQKRENSAFSPLIG